jgi:hypothetical protein
MDSTRKVSIVSGVTFIVATVTGLVAGALLPGQNSADYLSWLSAHSSEVISATILYIVGYLASAGVAVAMYPVMRKANAGLAIGSVVFRAVEAVFYLVGVVALLSLLTLGRQFAAAATADRALLQAIGDAFVSLRERAGLMGVLSFCVGGFMYYYLFFKSRLVPRWLSGFGIVAVITMMIACVLSLYSGNRINSYIALAAPVFLQEMVLAVWLIAKGFDTRASASRPVATEAGELLRAA